MLRRLAPQPETTLECMGLAFLGLLGLASAAVCGVLAAPHAALCQVGQAAHCGWCYAQAGFAILAPGAWGLAVARLSAAARPSPAISAT